MRGPTTQRSTARRIAAPPSTRLLTPAQRQRQLAIQGLTISGLAIGLGLVWLAS